MKNKIKISLAILSMILAFVLSYACARTNTNLTETHEVQTEDSQTDATVYHTDDCTPDDTIELINKKLETVSESDSSSFKSVIYDEQTSLEAESCSSRKNVIILSTQNKSLEKPPSTHKIIDYNNLPFLVDGKIANGILSKQINAWDRVPQALRDSFEKEGWKLVITEEDLAKTRSYLGYEEIAGLTNYGDRIIYIEDRKILLKIQPCMNLDTILT